MSKKDTSTKPLMFYGKILLVLVLVIVGAVYLGKSDSGQIDINSAIDSANKTRKDADSSATKVETVPEEFRNKVNGGLVPQGGAQQPQAEPVTETPSTSPDSETATSTKLN